MERDAVRKIRWTLQARGVWVVKIHGGPNQPAGLPDLIGCYAGRFIGLEVKDPMHPAHTTALQRATLDAIRAHGGISGVVTTPEEAIALIFG